MRDPKLEAQIEHCEHFIYLWQEFHHLLKKARDDAQEIGQDDETKFFTLKTSIAKRYSTLMKSLGYPEEIKGVEVLAQMVNMQEFRKATDGIARRNLQIWNEQYIKLQGMLGELEQTRQELARLSRIVLWLGKVLWNPLTVVIYMIIVVLIAYMGVAWIIQKFNLFS